MARRRGPHSLPLAIPIALVVAAPGLFSSCAPKDKPHVVRSGAAAAPVTTLSPPIPATPSFYSISYTQPRRLTYVVDVKPHMLGCARCHVSGGPSGRFGLSSPNLVDDVADYTALLHFVDPVVPANSPLLMKAAEDRVTHGGGACLAKTDLGYLVTQSWISGGCQFQ